MGKQECITVDTV